MLELSNNDAIKNLSQRWEKLPVDINHFDNIVILRQSSSVRESSPIYRKSFKILGFTRLSELIYQSLVETWNRLVTIVDAFWSLPSLNFARGLSDLKILFSSYFQAMLALTFSIKYDHASIIYYLIVLTNSCICWFVNSWTCINGLVIFYIIIFTIVTSIKSDLLASISAHIYLIS